MKGLRLAKQIRLNCKRRGARVLLESPLTSKAWKLTPWLGSEPGAAMTHQCAEGSKLVDFLGDPVKKPTWFPTAAIMLGAEFNSTRCDNARERTSVINRPKGAASSLGNWTANLARAIMSGIENQPDPEKQH
eukprot:9472521-Pyramimonas_sp.AAC.1